MPSPLSIFMAPESLAMVNSSSAATAPPKSPAAGEEAPALLLEFSCGAAALAALAAAARRHFFSRDPLNNVLSRMSMILMTSDAKFTLIEQSI